MRREWIARTALLLILVGLPTVILGYQFWIRPATNGIRVIDIRAAAPEAGGFQPDSIQVQAGETVTLRFIADDVTHGIAIGPGLGVDLGQVDPGYVKEETLTFDHAGTFTFYCNTWCSLDHWRMRGIIEVHDLANPIPTPQRDPVIEALVAEGVNIDATHETTDLGPPHDMPDIDPSVTRGAALIPRLSVPAELQDGVWRRSHTPEEALDLLRVSNPGFSQTDLIDTVAYLWARDTSSALSVQAQTLYNQNCAACHGQTGGGDGPVANLIANEPVAFSDAAYMFTRRNDVLYPKIRRGGMGTDMPNFGTLFTPEETWALVDYLLSLSAPESSQP
jgi:mono/diheme cytochrome c family protein/plastocyanin